MQEPCTLGGARVIYVAGERRQLKKKDDKTKNGEGAMHFACTRATTEGVDQEALERALNSDDPKAALVDSIIDITAGRGLYDGTMLTVLVSGSGDAAAETLAAALEQAVGVLEQLSISSPRKSRKLLLEAMDRIEATLEVVDSEWCAGMISNCDRVELEHLSRAVVSVEALSSSSAVTEASDAVHELLSCVDRCGSVVVGGATGCSS